MFSRVRVNDDQVGLWFRRGQFLRSLGPGDYPLVVFDDQPAADVIEVIKASDPRRGEVERPADDASGNAVPA